mgnify:CR=1 FL=1
MRRAAALRPAGSKEAASPRCEPEAGELRSLRLWQRSVALTGEEDGVAESGEQRAESGERRRDGETKRRRDEETKR